MIAPSEARRRRFGAFYTPKTIAEALAHWAIRSPTDRVLDPSFGGCVFLSSAIAVLSSRGGENAKELVFGIDVDRKAFSQTANSGLAINNLRCMDFFQAAPSDIGHLKFQAIVGNPPFIRHHALSGLKRHTAERAIARNGHAIGGAPAYWAYFVLHSLSFLDKGGRLAFVVPGAALSAQYAAAVRTAVSMSFRDVALISIQERIFPEAETEIVLLLAEGFREGPCHPLVQSAETADEALEIVRTERSYPKTRYLLSDDWKVNLLPIDARDVLAGMHGNDAVRSFGQLAKTKIGVVTGANTFFVMRPSDIRRHHLSSRHFRPIVQRATMLKRLSLTRTAIKQFAKSDCRCYLLVAPSSSKSENMSAYIRTAAARGLSKRLKCRERDPWYSISDLSTSDAFLTYVNAFAPRLILNRADALSTNAIHRVWWSRSMSLKKQKVIALSFLTSLTGLTAEVYGRVCGGGALKIEPSHAQRLLVAVPGVKETEIESAFETVSRLLAIGAWNRARALADSVVLGGGLGLSKHEIECVRQGHDLLRGMRRTTIVSESANGSDPAARGSVPV